MVYPPDTPDTPDTPVYTAPFKLYLKPASLEQLDQCLGGHSALLRFLYDWKGWGVEYAGNMIAATRRGEDSGEFDQAPVTTVDLAMQWWSWQLAPPNSTPKEGISLGTVILRDSLGQLMASADIVSFVSASSTEYLLRSPP